MKLVMQRVHMNKCNCRESKQITLDRDFNVPDARPDALQIMKEQGEIQIEEAHMMEGKASIKGNMHFQGLYAAEGEARISEMSGSIPFEEMIPLSCAERGDELTVQASFGDLRSELINSRKLGMKAIVNLDVKAETVCDGEGAVDMEEAENVYCQKKTLDISRLVFSKKDTLRVRDEWKIPGTKDAIGKILYTDVQLGEMNTRMLENELQADGQATFFVVYLGEGEEGTINYFENTIPIQGTIDCDGCQPDNVAQVMCGIHSRDIEIKEDEDGENRVMDIELVVDFDIKVYGQEQLELLTDFYSLTELCKPIYKESFFENLVVHNKNKAKFTGKVETGEYAPLQIWNVTGDLRVDRQIQKADCVVVEGVVDTSILYLTGDERIPLATVKGSIPFEQTVEAEGITENSNVWLRGTLEQISGTVTGEKEIEVKAVAALDVIAFERIEEPIICDYESEEIDWKARSREPGMVGYVVKEGETLWDVAKQFSTTEDSIREINQLEQATIQTGDILLVLKEVC